MTAPTTETDAFVNLLPDPVTGEMISKSELKRRLKQREKEGKKAEKTAAAPAKPTAEKVPNVSCWHFN